MIVNIGVSSRVGPSCAHHQVIKSAATKDGAETFVVDE